MCIPECAILDEVSSLDGMLANIRYKGKYRTNMTLISSKPASMSTCTTSTQTACAMDFLHNYSFCFRRSSSPASLRCS